MVDLWVGSRLVHLHLEKRLGQHAVVVLQPVQVVVELQPALVELQVVVEQLWGAEVL